MTPEEFQAEVDRNQQADQEASKEQAKLNALKQTSASITKAVNSGAQATVKGLKKVKGEVKVTNPDLAKTEDVASAVEAINKLNLTTFMQNEGLPQLADNIEKLTTNVQSLQKEYENKGLKELSTQLSKLVSQLKEVSSTLLKAKVEVGEGLQNTIDSLKTSIDAIDFKPTVNVSSPAPKVVTTPVNLEPVVEALKGVKESVEAIETPDTEVNLKPVTRGLTEIVKTISNLRFPSSNYVLPFKDNVGKATQVKLTENGSLPVAATIDTSAISTSANQTNGTQKTQIVDAGGDAATVTGGKLDVNASVDTTGLATSAKQDDIITAIEAIPGGGGVQYTEGDTDSSITGTAVMWEDGSDTLRPVSAAKPLPIGDAGGSLTVDGTVVVTGVSTAAKQDTGNTSLASIDTKLPSQGQALAAASVPVVLPAAQITTLTPPAAITGFATAANQTDKSQFSKITDGTDTLLVTASGEANVLESNSASIKTAVEKIDDIVSGSGANISQINGVTPLMGAGNTGTGSPRVTIASDQAVIPISDNSGSLTVDQGTAANLNMTEASASAIKTSVELLDDSVYTDDTSTHATGTSKGLGIMAAATPTDTSVNANDMGILAMTTDRRLLVDASGVAVPVTDNSGSLTVDYATTGSGTATGALRVELPTNGTGVLATVGAVTAITNALPAGTNAIGKLAANSGVDIGDVDVTTVGTITPGTAATSLGKAEDAAHTTGDVGVGALGARNDTLATQTNADGDYALHTVDLAGRTLTTNAPRALKVAQQTTITSSTSETTVLTAVASTFLDVYGVIVVNTSATACDVTFKDATAGTTRFNLYVPAGDTRGFMLPMDAAHPQASSNNNWTATCGTSVASIKITMLAVKMI